MLLQNMENMGVTWDHFATPKWLDGVAIHKFGNAFDDLSICSIMWCVSTRSIMNIFYDTILSMGKQRFKHHGEHCSMDVHNNW